jgi:thioredoxin reductase (NADPH)
MPSPEQRTDVVIIGAGPVGLFAIFECGMLGLKCHVVDALDVLGGQCSALYPEKPIYDVPGFPKIQAGELIERLREQAAPFAPVFHLGQRVEMLMAAEGDRWLAGTEAGTRINARAVVIAGGGGAFGPKRPPLPGIERFEGKGVFYAVQRRADHEGKRVVIVGGGDSAVDWALSLAEIAERVTVVHRRPKFRAAPDSAQRLKRLAADGAIDLVIPFQPVGLEGDDGRLTAVIVRSLDGEERRLEADVLLPFFGLAASLGPIAKWGLELERNHVKVDPATCLTNVPGIFAIGDIAVFPGKLKLILSGFAEAAMAAHAIYPLVHPDQELHFEYSTMTGVPGRG